MNYIQFLFVCFRISFFAGWGGGMGAEQKTVIAFFHHLTLLGMVTSAVREPQMH